MIGGAHFHIMIELNVACGHRAGALLGYPQYGLFPIVHAHGQALEIKQDRNDVLLRTGHR